MSRLRSLNGLLIAMLLGCGTGEPQRSLAPDGEVFTCREPADRDAESVMLRLFNTDAEVELGRLLTLKDVQSLRGGTASSSLPTGDAVLQDHFSRPFRHPNGVVQLPKGTLESVKSYVARYDETGRAKRMRRFEALVLHGLYDPSDAVQRMLREDYLRGPAPFEVGPVMSQQTGAELDICKACYYSCHLYAATNQSSTETAKRVAGACDAGSYASPGETTNNAFCTGKRIVPALQGATEAKAGWSCDRGFDPQVFCNFVPDGGAEEEVCDRGISMQVSSSASAFALSIANRFAEVGKVPESLHHKAIAEASAETTIKIAVLGEDPGAFTAKASSKSGGPVLNCGGGITNEFKCNLKIGIGLGGPSISPECSGNLGFSCKFEPQGRRASNKAKATMVARGNKTMAAGQTSVSLPNTYVRTNATVSAARDSDWWEGEQVDDTGGFTKVPKSSSANALTANNGQVSLTLSRTSVAAGVGTIPYIDKSPPGPARVIAACGGSAQNGGIMASGGAQTASSTFPDFSDEEGFDDLLSDCHSDSDCSGDERCEPQGGSYPCACVEGPADAGPGGEDGGNVPGDDAGQGDPPDAGPGPVAEAGPDGGGDPPEDAGPQGCVNQGDCPPQHICQGGACIPIPGACQGDGDCRPDQQCQGGLCVPRQGGGGCENDGDCPAQHRCQGGACIPMGGGCMNDQDCRPDQVCNAGMCQPRGGGGNGCARDEDCREDELCVNGACQPFCAEDDQCGEGQRCDSNDFICVPEGPSGQGQPCNADEHCRRFLICNNGSCAPG